MLLGLLRVLRALFDLDDEDFHLDLLFYNRKLRRLVAVELKIGEFKAAYKVIGLWRFHTSMEPR